MITNDKITTIFCSIDDFCKDVVPNWEKSMLLNGKWKKAYEKIPIIPFRSDNYSSAFSYFQGIEILRNFTWIMCANS